MSFKFEKRIVVFYLSLFIIFILTFIAGGFLIGLLTDQYEDAIQLLVPMFISFVAFSMVYLLIVVIMIKEQLEKTAPKLKTALFCFILLFIYSIPLIAATVIATPLLIQENHAKEQLNVEAIRLLEESMADLGINGAVVTFGIHTTWRNLREVENLGTWFYFRIEETEIRGRARFSRQDGIWVLNANSLLNDENFIEVNDFLIEEVEIKEVEIKPVINTAYLDYFTVDDGYQIVYSSEISGEQFDFVVYELAEINSELSSAIVVIVIKNEEVFTVLHGSSMNTAFILRTEHTQMVIEADVDFDGRNDILLWHGFSGSHGHPHSAFTAYLQRDGYFEENESFRSILNPWVDLKNERIVGATSGRYHSSRHHYYYIDGEFIRMASLISRLISNVNGDWVVIWTEERIIDGLKQTRQLCTVMYDGEVCTQVDTDIVFDRELYERMFGVNGYWNCSNEMGCGIRK